MATASSSLIDGSASDTGRRSSLTKPSFPMKSGSTVSNHLQRLHDKAASAILDDSGRRSAMSDGNSVRNFSVQDGGNDQPRRASDPVRSAASNDHWPQGQRLANKRASGPEMQNITQGQVSKKSVSCAIYSSLTCLTIDFDTGNAFVIFTY